MTEVVAYLYGGCIAAGCALGAVVAIVNSWGV